MNPQREWIERELAHMTEGQEIVIDRELFERSFPCGWPSIYRTHREAFLSSRIGSAWGVWTCDREMNARGNYRIGHHKGDENRRVYCDPDREHLFNRLPSGELVPKEP